MRSFATIIALALSVMPVFAHPSAVAPSEQWMLSHSYMSQAYQFVNDDDSEVIVTALVDGSILVFDKTGLEMSKDGVYVSFYTWDDIDGACMIYQLYEKTSGALDEWMVLSSEGELEMFFNPSGLCVGTHAHPINLCGWGVIMAARQKFCGNKE